MKKELLKAYIAKDYETAIYKKWLDSGYFNPDKLKSKGPAFTISMPPPNATGILHVGHASGLTYEDLIIRYKRLQGYKTLWLPGTDHAAIATQAKVEKLLATKGLDRHKLGRAKFLKEVKDVLGFMDYEELVEHLNGEFQDVFGPLSQFEQYQLGVIINSK